MGGKAAAASGEAAIGSLSWEPHRTFNMALSKGISELKPLGNVKENKGGANSNENWLKT